MSERILKCADRGYPIVQSKLVLFSKLRRLSKLPNMEQVCFYDIMPEISYQIHPVGRWDQSRRTKWGDDFVSMRSLDRLINHWTTIKDTEWKPLRQKEATGLIRPVSLELSGLRSGGCPANFGSLWKFTQQLGLIIFLLSIGRVITQGLIYVSEL